MDEIISVLVTVASLHLPVLLIPGADVVLTTSYGVLRGRVAALLAAAGITLGSVIMVAVSLLCINTVVQLPLAVITIVKLIGAIYLVYLMMTTLAPLLRKKSPKTNQVRKESLADHPLAVGLLTEITNPKTIIFFIALFSLVIERHPVSLLWIASGIAVLFTGLYYTGLALLSSQQLVNNLLVKNEKFVRIIAAGLFLYAAISLIV